MPNRLFTDLTKGSSSLAGELTLAEVIFYTRVFRADTHMRQALRRYIRANALQFRRRNAVETIVMIKNTHGSSAYFCADANMGTAR